MLLVIILVVLSFRLQSKLAAAIEFDILAQIAFDIEQVSWALIIELKSILVAERGNLTPVPPQLRSEGELKF